MAPEQTSETDDKGSFEEYERQQEMLAHAVKDNLRQLEQMANHFEKEGNTTKAKELRDLLAKLTKNLQRQEKKTND